MRTPPIRTLRAALSRGTIVAAIAWTLVILFIETFKGSNVGGPACYTDPTCGEVGWVPTAAWVGGILVILVIGHGPTGRQPATTLADKLVAVVVAVTVLVIAAAVFTFYQDHRPIADLWLGIRRT